jgi:hypothetical protein
MKKIITTIALLLTIIACDQAEDTDELRGREYEACFEATPEPSGGASFAVPAAEYYTCCFDGQCSAPVAGACPGGGVLHWCEDDLTCNSDTCWHECAPVPLENS